MITRKQAVEAMRRFGMEGAAAHLGVSRKAMIYHRRKAREEGVKGLPIEYPLLTPEDVEYIKAKWEPGRGAAIARILGVSKSAIYYHVRRWNSEGK